MRAAIAKSEAIGRQLYVLDKVAAIATDVVAERVPDFGDQVAGYLPLHAADEDGQPASSFLVIFFTREEPLQIVYEVRLAPDVKPKFEAFSPPKPANPSIVELARARRLAIAALPSRRQPLNPVMMPAEINDEEGILVYLLAGTNQPGVVVFGQHFRVLVPEGGDSPSYVLPLSKAILEMPVARDALEIAVTHLVTDWPLETHVLASLQTRLPVIVLTKRGVWRVDGDKITLIGDPPST